MAWHTKWHLDPSSRLAATDMGRKVRAAVPLLGELGPHATQCAWAEEACPCIKWHLDLSSHLATIDVRQNWVGVGVPFFWG